MDNRFYTIQELFSTRFYELPNGIYNQIVTDMRKKYGSITEKLLLIFDKAKLIDIEQFTDIYKYIRVI